MWRKLKPSLVFDIYFPLTIPSGWSKDETVFLHACCDMRVRSSGQAAYTLHSSGWDGRRFGFEYTSARTVIHLNSRWGVLFNIGCINECTSCSCTVVLGLLRDNDTHGSFNGKFLGKEYCGGIRNREFLGCGSGRYWGFLFEGRRDEVVFRPHPMVTPLSPSCPTSPPCPSSYLI